MFDPSHNKLTVTPWLSAKDQTSSLEFPSPDPPKFVDDGRRVKQNGPAVVLGWASTLGCSNRNPKLGMAAGLVVTWHMAWSLL